MDDIIEIIIEVVLEGLLELMKSKRIPLVIRFMIYLLFAGILLSISGLLIWCSYNSKSMPLAMICLFLSIVVLIILIYMTKVVFKK